jgi:hypothetical protein
MIIPSFPLPFLAKPLKREMKFLGDKGGGKEIQIFPKRMTD